MSLCSTSLGSVNREASGFACVESPAPAPAPAFDVLASLYSRKAWREVLAQEASKRAARELKRYLAFSGPFAESERLRAKWEKALEAEKRANARWFAAWDEYLGALK